MFSRIAFTALLRGSAHGTRSHEYLRTAQRRRVTTPPSPPSPCPPGLGPPSPLPPSPAPTHHITLPSQRHHPPRWPPQPTRLKGTWSHDLAGRLNHCSA